MIRRAIYVMLAFDLVMLGIWLTGDRVPLLVLNAKGGCYPWSPAQVEYHDGMTLCPGQAATMRIEITQEPEDKGI